MIGLSGARLPRLRDDLRLHEGPPNFDGEPTWQIHDPVRGSYFRIGAVAARLLRHWPQGAPHKVLAAANRRACLAATPADLEQFERFLRANNLVAGGETGMLGLYLDQAEKAKKAQGTRLIHSYLFARLPLLRPDRFLTATLPLVRPLLTRGFLIACLLLGLIGLYLVSRQWDSFIGTLPYFFTLQGAAQLALTIGIVKILHEFGHAYMAKRFGCRVHVMGVALIVMFPVLYTDTTDAWKLRDRRQRLLIGGAGLMVELCLAGLATFAWAFLPDGAVRSSLFMVATVTWITSLTVNLNPMLRFDGYYLFSDLIGVDNLQARGFALGRWRLRQALFGFGHPPPERYPPRTYRALLIYAYATWIWRLALFVFIALILYHFVFKLLALVLIALQLTWFVARPIALELKEWWMLRGEMRMNRNLIVALALLAAGFWALLTPWQSHVGLPAVLEARQDTALHVGEPGRLIEVAARPGDRVLAGDVLYRLEAPDLSFNIAALETEVQVIQELILRQAASLESAGRTGVLEQELAEQLARLRGLRDRTERLTVRAPADGRLVDVIPGLSPGRWLSPRERLGRLLGEGEEEARLIAYVSGDDLSRLEAGAQGRFLPEDPARAALPVRVVGIEATAVGALDSLALASIHGGPLAVREDPATGRLVPDRALYRVLLEPTEPLDAPRQVLRGTARIEAEAISPLARLGRLVVGVLIRESGF